MACTFPHHVHRNAFSKYMATVENATNDGTLEAFPSEEDDERVSGPYTGYDKRSLSSSHGPLRMCPERDVSETNLEIETTAATPYKSPTRL